MDDGPRTTPFILGIPGNQSIKRVCGRATRDCTRAFEAAEKQQKKQQRIHTLRQAGKSSILSISIPSSISFSNVSSSSPKLRALRQGYVRVKQTAHLMNSVPHPRKRFIKKRVILCTCSRDAFNSFNSSRRLPSEMPTPARDYADATAIIPSAKKGRQLIRGCYGDLGVAVGLL